MSRLFCIPGIVFLLCATVLSFLTSISLPYLTKIDIARVNFGNAGGAGTVQSGINELRVSFQKVLSSFGMAVADDLRFRIACDQLGVWAHCAYDENGTRTCSKAQTGYTINIASSTNRQSEVTIGSSWTRGLAVHPLATAVTFIAFLLSFSTHRAVTLVSSLVCFLAALLTLIAFAIDIALFVYVRHQAKKVDGLEPDTDAGTGFWLTFVTLILLLISGCTVCLGRRRDRMAGATPAAYPVETDKPKKQPFWARFKKNKA
ncbi:hypothetical protein HGRIS_007013 [Hohenbuehelia grisea]|uniref:Pali-domain-containing protein n=1 Tax=Hohenbuehelia grisea TaxID=104357 RepID=A0ABR3JAS6_9AGAR